MASRVAARWLQAKGWTGLESADKVLATFDEHFLRMQARNRTFGGWFDLIETKSGAGEPLKALERSLDFTPYHYTIYDARGKVQGDGVGDDNEIQNQRAQAEARGGRIEIDEREADQHKLTQLVEAADRRYRAYEDLYADLQPSPDDLVIEIRSHSEYLGAELWDPATREEVRKPVGKVWARMEDGVRSLVKCQEEMEELVSRYGDKLPVWVILQSELDEALWRKGLGKALYRALFDEIARRWTRSYVSGHVCLGGSTSMQARRVWKSLAREYPHARVADPLVLVVG